MAEFNDGNVYVRLSLVRPKSGQEEKVSDILNDLVGFYAGQPGYLQGYTLVTTAPGSEVGRLTMWRSERDAETTASTQHVMAQRSELMRLVEGGSHIERSFTALPHLAPEAPPK
ncbi:MAG TPA: hypothetical protein VK821_03100 [Dehalococcoidia bacterium]|nr:hypothetical protein [Dehalococcoidia bacterium]